MTCATAQFIGSKTPVALGRGQKINFHQISITKPIPKIFNQTLCVVSQVNDIKPITKDFYPVAWVMPQGWDFWVLEDQKLNFLKIVMWYIQLKGLISRPGYTEIFYRRIQL